MLVTDGPVAPLKRLTWRVAEVRRVIEETPRVSTCRIGPAISPASTSIWAQRRPYMTRRQPPGGAAAHRSGHADRVRAGVAGPRIRFYAGCPIFVGADCVGTSGRVRLMPKPSASSVISPP